MGRSNRDGVILISDAQALPESQFFNSAWDEHPLFALAMVFVLEEKISE